MLATKCDVEIKLQRTAQRDQGLAGSSLIWVSLLRVWQCECTVLTNEHSAVCRWLSIATGQSNVCYMAPHLRV